MGVDTVERAHGIYEKAKSFLLNAGFNVCKWRTSDKTLQNVIDSKKLFSQNMQKKLRVMNRHMCKPQLGMQVN